MKYRVIKNSQVEEIDRGFIKVRQLLNQDDINNVSVAIIKINGTNKRIINTKSDAVYYVIEGNGFFDINDEEVKVETGDLIFIPKGTTYFDKGSLTMLSINNPRYDQSAIEYLD